jgi:hypothetical protein
VVVTFEAAVGGADGTEDCTAFVADCGVELELVTTVVAALLRELTTAPLVDSAGGEMTLKVAVALHAASEVPSGQQPLSVQ